MMCEGCAYHVDNWFYGYQVYCVNPTEFWINPLGWVLIVLLYVGLIYNLYRTKKEGGRDES